MADKKKPRMKNGVKSTEASKKTIARKTTPKTGLMPRMGASNLNNPETVRLDCEAACHVMVDNISEIMWQVSPDLHYTHYNSADARVLGYLPDELIGKSVFEFMTPDSADYVRKIAMERQNSARHGERLEKMVYEVEHVRKDGTFIWTEAISYPIYNADGQLTAFNGVTHDITERKRMETELRSVNDKLETTLNALPDLFFEVDETGRFYDYRANNVEKLYTPPEFFLGRTVEEILPPESAAVIMGAIQEAADTGISRGSTYCLPMPSGEQWFEMSIALKRFVSGTDKRLIALVRDITARKKVEKALRDSELKLRTIFEGAKDGIIVASLAGNIVTVNPSFAAMHGYTVQEMLNMNLKDLGSPEDARLLPARIERLREGDTLTCEVEHYCKNGQMIQLDVSSSLVNINGKQYIFGFHRDISNRKKAQEALINSFQLSEKLVNVRTAELKKAYQELKHVVSEQKRTEEILHASENLHRTIVKTAMDGFLVHDIQGRIAAVNESYCKMSGYSEKELLTMSLFDLRDTSFSDEIRSHIHNVKSAGTNRFESTHRRKDGSNFNVEISARYLPIDEGRIVGFIRDITETKKAEDRLRQSEERLAVRSQELEEMNNALKVLLKQREHDQIDIEGKVRTNVRQLVLPYIEKLKKRKSGEDAALIHIIEANLDEVISTLATTTLSYLHRLTPQELLVANLIKEGKQDKDISDILSASIHTVKAHRRNIRKKLGLTNQGTNLRTYLSTL
jgi:PAS domain S-box-containing protein